MCSARTTTVASRTAKANVELSSLKGASKQQIFFRRSAHGLAWWWILLVMDGLRVYIVILVILVMGEMDGNGWKWNVWIFSASPCAGCFGRLLAVPRLISLRLGRILCLNQPSIMPPSLIQDCSIGSLSEMAYSNVLEWMECMTISCNLMNWWHIMAVNCSIPCHPCWYFFRLEASVAERPEILQQAILSKTIDPRGKYKFRLWNLGFDPDREYVIAQEGSSDFMIMSSSSW